jgi:hypothetical protein
MTVFVVAFSDKAVCESIFSDFVIRVAILRDSRLIDTRLRAFQGMEIREMAGISDPGDEFERAIACWAQFEPKMNGARYWLRLSEANK